MESGLWTAVETILRPNTSCDGKYERRNAMKNLYRLCRGLLCMVLTLSIPTESLAQALGRVGQRGRAPSSAPSTPSQAQLTGTFNAMVAEVKAAEPGWFGSAVNAVVGTVSWPFDSFMGGMKEYVAENTSEVPWLSSNTSIETLETAQLKTIEQYAHLADQAYREGERSPLSRMPEGYQALAVLTDEDSGFRAAVFKSSDNALVLAFEGTVDRKDWDANARQAVGSTAGQYELAARTLEILKQQWPGKIIVVGHSEGGGEGQYAMLRTDLDERITGAFFNSAGLSNPTISEFDINNISGAGAHSTHIRVEGDTVSFHGQLTGEILQIPNGGMYTVNAAHSMDVVLTRLGEIVQGRLAALPQPPASQHLPPPKSKPPMYHLVEDMVCDFYKAFDRLDLPAMQQNATDAVAIWLESSFSFLQFFGARAGWMEELWMGEGIVRVECKLLRCTFRICATRTRGGMGDSSCFWTSRRC